MSLLLFIFIQILKVGAVSVVNRKMRKEVCGCGCVFVWACVAS